MRNALLFSLFLIYGIIIDIRKGQYPHNQRLSANYGIGELGKRCGESQLGAYSDIESLQECQQAQHMLQMYEEYFKDSTFVHALGNGTDLPFGCISDRVSNKHYVYWNPEGTAISNDPNIRTICINVNVSSNPFHPFLYDNSMIDTLHLQQYPYCGSMDYSGNAHGSSARIANSESPKEFYRWTVYQIRLINNKHELRCSGTIITDSHILTAAHCICDRVNSETEVQCLLSYNNQIRPGKNEITARGGSYKMDEIMAPDYIYTWKMDFGYVMDNDDNTYDVGIAGIDPNNKNKFFDKENLFQNWKTSKIVPLCLAKQSTDITNKVVQGAGWGRVYEEQPKTTPRNPVFSSCMTNQASPDMWRFQNCDLDRLPISLPFRDKIECIKNKDPPDYQTGQSQKCQKIYNDAGSKAKNVDKIYLSDNLDSDEIFDDLQNPEICYNPNLLSNHGWCYLKDFPEKWEAQVVGKPWNREAWGICSPSCDTNINQATGQPANNKEVQEMKWRADVSSFSHCKKQVDWFNSETMYCMKYELPDTHTMVFKKRGISGVDLNKYYHRKVEPPKGHIAYRMGCGGDSGSGQFISNDVEYRPENLNRFKYFQVAVYTMDSINTFTHGGKMYRMPCGTFSYNMKESKRLNDEGNYIPWIKRAYYRNAGISHKTTKRNVLLWIKIKAGICKDEESCIIS